MIMQKSSSNRKPIFIAGTGRCGTVTWANIFSTVPCVVAFHEGSRIIEEKREKKFAVLNGKKHLLVQKGNAVMGRSRIQPRIAFISKCVGTTFVEANPLIWVYIPYFKEIFPELKVVHLIRNPVSFVRSCAIRLSMYHGEQYKTEFSKSQWPFPEDWPRLKKLCSFWVEVNKKIRSLNPVLSVRLEDLNVDSVSQILGELGLPKVFDKKCLKVFNKNSAPLGDIRPIKEAVQKWIPADLIESFWYGGI